MVEVTDAIKRNRCFPRCPTDPIGKRGTVEIDTLATHDLGLPIEW